MEKLLFPLISAHTGCGNAPDNTIESFMEGIHMGADVVEVDVRVTKDDVPILLHDDSPYLQEYTFEQLNQLEIRAKLSSIYKQFEIVKLEEIIRIAEQGTIQLNLDIKSGASIEPTVRLIENSTALKQIFITGCSDQILQYHPEIQVFLNTPMELTVEEEQNYSIFVHKVCGEAKLGSYYGLNMYFRTCRRELVEAAQTMGLAVWVYTVNDTSDMKSLIEIQVDGITTMAPKKLLDFKMNHLV